MSYRSLAGQSAIEYLMTYGWMLLVVAIVGGTIFSVTQSQGAESVSGFSGSDVLVDDFGVTSDGNLSLALRNGDSSNIVVSSVNVSDSSNGNWVYKEFVGDSRVSVGSERLFELPFVSRTDGSNVLDVRIIYDTGGLSNLTESGTITGRIGLTDTRSVSSSPSDGSTGDESGDTTKTWSTAHSSAPDCSTVSYNGSGISSNPYNVTNDWQLQCIYDQGMSDHYQITQNINASLTSQWNSGNGFHVISVPQDDGYGTLRMRQTPPFSGEITGNGYTIKGLHSEKRDFRTEPYGNGLIYELSGSVQNLSIKEAYMGAEENSAILVGSYSKGTISQVDVRSSKVSVNDVSGDSGNGGLVGTNDGTIEYSSFSGTVDAGGNNVGGLVGTSFGSGNIVKNSYANATISASSGSNVGGLIGFNSGSSAQNTNNYAVGQITNGENVGGLVGQSDIDTVNSYAAVNVSGNSAVGGLIGNNRGGSTVDSYWDVPASTVTTSSGSATGFGTLTDQEPVSNMTGSQAQAELSGFDFNNHWETVESSDSDASEEGYPLLRNLSREKQLKVQGVYSE